MTRQRSGAKYIVQKKETYEDDPNLFYNEYNDQDEENEMDLDYLKNSV